MSSIYFLRHQAAGILTGYPFAQPPTAEQRKPIEAMLRAAHGPKHPKTSEPYWVTVVECPIVQPGDLPVVRLPVGKPTNKVGGAGGADGDTVSVGATGTVKNPGD